MHEQQLILRVPVLMTILTMIGIATVPLAAHADKLDDLDKTMQVLDDIEDLDNTAASLRVPDEDDGNADGAADESAAASDTDFDDDFEHDVELEEELMQDEDDFEDGDDVDDDRVSTEPVKTP